MYWAGRAEKLRAWANTFTVNDMEPISLARTSQLLTFFEAGRPRTVQTLPNVQGPAWAHGDSAPAPFWGYLST